VRLRLTLDRPTRQQLLTFGGYCAAGAVYIVIGVAWTDFLYSFWVGTAYILLAAWVVPTIAKRVS
jgi:hypothetical protein